MPEQKVDIGASRKLIAAATPGPWELWKDHAAVFAGPAKVNTPGVLSGYRGAICDLDSGCIDTDELEYLDESEWSTEERITMNRFNDAAFIVAARDPETGWPATLTALEKALLQRDTSRLAEMHNYLKSPAMETFADLKHSNAGIVLAMLGDGAISRSKCCEALAQLAHGFSFDDIPLPQEKGRQFSEDEIPAEVVERLEKELAEARAKLKRRDEKVKPTVQWGDGTTAHCECGESLNAPKSATVPPKFCHDCGRRLDWSGQ